MARGKIEAALLLDEHGAVTLAELVALTGLAEESVDALAAAGVLPQLPGGEPRFASSGLALARRARRLAVALELDEAGLVLAMSLLTRIEELEARLREIECMLPRC